MKRKIVKKVKGTSANGTAWFAVVLEEVFNVQTGELFPEKLQFIRSEAIFEQLEEGFELIVH